MDELSSLPPSLSPQLFYFLLHFNLKRKNKQTNKRIKKNPEVSNHLVIEGTETWRLLKTQKKESEGH